MIQTHGVEKLLPVIRSVWTDTETAYHEGGNWEFIWNEVDAINSVSFQERSRLIMTQDEFTFFEKLPSQFVVYRGFNVAYGEFGWSWTLDRVKAEWFAHRLADADAEPCVATMKIEKSDAFAYFAGRNEAEIVINLETAWLESAKIEKLVASTKAS